ncbi:hypothetical protein Q5752_000442 [Cryptotrichosporon argae]
MAQMPLARTLSNHSAHAHASLVRMATHEGALHAHDEDHSHDEDEAETPGEPSRDLPGVADEEKAVGGGGEGEREGAGANSNKEVQLQDQTNLLPTRQVILVFVGLTCALFCSLIDQTIVTTAWPTIGRDFGSADIASWIGTSYLLTSTAMQPMYGRLSDIFGRKTVLLASLGVFLIGSLACSVAHSMIQLIVFRAIQGLGGGGILTLSMIIISDVVSLKERGKYQGITGAVVAMSNSLGPILGGVFTQKTTWRWCFYINLPLTSAAIVIIIFLLPLKRVRGAVWTKLRKIDWWGSLLTIVWATLVLIALSWAGSKYAWSSAGVLAPLLVGLAALAAFVVVEHRARLPLIPLHIFRNTHITANFVTTFFSGWAFYASLYYLPNYFQIVRGASPISSGVYLLPLIVVQTVTAFTSGILVSKTGDYWWNLVFGFGIWTIGLGLLSTITPDTPLSRNMGYQALAGIGAGQTFQTSLIAIQAALERKDVAAATGCRNFVRQLGGTLALAACTALVNAVVERDLAPWAAPDLVSQILNSPTELAALGLDDAQMADVRAAYARGVDACFWLMIPMAGISFVITILFVKKLELGQKDTEQRKAESKAWLEARKARKAGRKGSAAPDAAQTTGTDERGNPPLGDTPETAGLRTEQTPVADLAANDKPVVNRVTGARGSDASAASDVTHVDGRDAKTAGLVDRVEGALAKEGRALEGDLELAGKKMAEASIE